MILIMINIEKKSSSRDPKISESNLQNIQLRKVLNHQKTWVTAMTICCLTSQIHAPTSAEESRSSAPLNSTQNTDTALNSASTPNTYL
jgi:hypothetical protein